MTVCVAAIANSGMIFAASDRMLSTAEIAFEPETSKIVVLTTAISALWCGDASIQAEVLGAVKRDVQAYVETDDPDWLSVGEVVDLYVAHWGAAKRKRAATAYLAPLGLTLEGFVGGQHGLPQATVDSLVNALIDYALPSTGCIVVGLDHSGSHIWRIENGVPQCANASGFASIGAGMRHADSQMMISRHSPGKTSSETLVTVHLAKKRGEVSPGVGTATDMMWIGPSLGQHGSISSEHLLKLDNDYEQVVGAERFAFNAAVVDFDEYINTMSQAPPDPQDTDAGHGALETAGEGGPS